MLKRNISILLSLLMVFSCLSFSGCNGGETTVNPKLSFVSFDTYNQSEGSFSTSSKSSVNVGDIVIVTIGFNAGSSAVKACGYILGIQYNSELLEVWMGQTSDKYFKGVCLDAVTSGIANPVKSVIAPCSEFSNSNGILKIMGMNSYSAGNKDFAKNTTSPVVQIAFKAKKSGTASFSFADNVTQIIYYSSGTSTADVKNITYLSSGNLIINQ